MEDKIKELYDILSNSKEFSGIYDSPEHLRGSLESNGEEFFNVLNSSSEFKGVFTDYGHFSSSLGLKKKVSTEPPTVGYETSSKYLQEDVSKKPKEPLAAPSPSVSKLSPVEELAEKFYTEKGWPSPTKKMSEWQSGVEAINKEIAEGKVTGEDATKRVTELANKIGLSYDPKTGTASLYPNDIDIYKGQLDKAYIQTIQDKSKTEKDSFLKDVLDNLNIGSHGVMTIPTRIMGVSERIGNAMLGLVDKDRNDATYWQDKASTDAAITDEWRANNARYDGTITELIQKGNMAGAAGQTIMSVAENLPLLTTLALGNAAGATNLTLGVMGADKAANEYLNSTSDPNMKEVSRIINAVGKGLSEIVFENIGTVSILNSVKKGIAKVGEQTIREQLIRSYTPYFQRQLSIAMKGASAMVREGGSEMATQLTDNLMDIAAGRDVKLGQGVGDAGIVGALIGGGLTAPQMIEEYKGGKSEFVKNIVSNIPENLDFEQKLELGELLVESAEIKYKQKQGIAGMDAVNKERLNTIQGKVAEILGVPLEPEGETKAETKTEPTIAEKPQVEIKTETLKTETNEIKPIKFYDALKQNNAPRIQVQDEYGNDKIVFDPSQRLDYLDKSDETGRNIRWGVELSDGRRVSLDGLIRITKPDIWQKWESKIKGMQLAKKNEFIISKTLKNDDFDQLLNTTIDFLETQDVFSRIYRGRDKNNNPIYEYEPNVNKINKILRDEGHPLAEIFGKTIKLSDGIERIPINQWILDIENKKRKNYNELALQIKTTEPKIEPKLEEETKDIGTDKTETIKQESIDAKQTLSEYLNNWAETTVNNKESLLKEIDTDYDMVLTKFKNMNLIETDCVS